MVTGMNGNARDTIFGLMFLSEQILFAAEKSKNHAYGKQ